MEARKTVDYWTKKFGVDIYLKNKLETLSKGNQQKVQITQAFLNEPDILILDEPFSGLDPVNSQVFRDALSEYINDDKIIIFSSHQMSYVESFCDEIAIINHGKIVLNGNLKEIKKDLGKDKLLISANNITNKELQSLLEESGFETTLEGDKVILALSDKDKASVLKVLVNKNIDIHQFQDYEPSLQDIFVLKVGDKNA